MRWPRDRSRLIRPRHSFTSHGVIRGSQVRGGVSKGCRFTVLQSEKLGCQPNQLIRSVSNRNSDDAELL